MIKVTVVVVVEDCYSGKKAIIYELDSKGAEWLVYRVALQETRTIVLIPRRVGNPMLLTYPKLSAEIFLVQLKYTSLFGFDILL